MRHVLKIIHVAALAVFVGSIPAHIVLGGAADPASQAAAFAILQQAKVTTIQALTLPGLAATVLSGVALAWMTGSFSRRWVRLKVAVTVLVALNGALVLTPTGKAIAALAREAVAAGSGPPALAALEAREAVFGAANLTLIGVIIALAVRRPALRGAPASAQERVS